MENIKILENKNLNGIEIYFNTKPTIEIITKLKNKKFRWHNVKKCWYAKNTEDIKDFIKTFDYAKIETTQKTEKRKSELKYLLHGIKDKNGKYYKCYFYFNEIYYTITIQHEDYFELPLLENTQGVKYKDDSDYYTDYICKPSMILDYSSIEFLDALNNLERINAKNNINENNSQIEKIKEIATLYLTDKDEAKKEYEKQVKENIKNKQEQEQKENIKYIKKRIQELQNEKENIKNNKPSFYKEIIENDNYIHAISLHEYKIIGYSKDNFIKNDQEFTITTINKNNLEKFSKTLSTQEAVNEYIEKFK